MAIFPHTVWHHYSSEKINSKNMNSGVRFELGGGAVWSGGGVMWGRGGGGRVAVRWMRTYSIYLPSQRRAMQSKISPNSVSPDKFINRGSCLKQTFNLFRGTTWVSSPPYMKHAYVTNFLELLSLFPWSHQVHNLLSQFSQGSFALSQHSHNVRFPRSV